MSRNCFFFLVQCSVTSLIMVVSLSLCLLCAFVVSTEGPPSCPKGCERCSEYNGCVKCKPKLFIFLERNDIRQVGVCLASCPVGYFGMRNPEGNNRCTREFIFVSPRPHAVTESGILKIYKGFLQVIADANQL